MVWLYPLNYLLALWDKTARQILRVESGDAWCSPLGVLEHAWNTEQKVIQVEKLGWSQKSVCSRTSGATDILNYMA